MKAQISTEMIIILAILLALVLVVATQLQKTAANATTEVREAGERITGVIGNISRIGTVAEGQTCTSTADCIAGLKCENGVCTA